MAALRRWFPLPAVGLILGLVVLAACGESGNGQTSNGVERVRDTLAEDSATEGGEHREYPAPPPDSPDAADTTSNE